MKASLLVNQWLQDKVTRVDDFSAWTWTKQVSAELTNNRSQGKLNVAENGPWPSHWTGDRIAIPSLGIL